MAGEKQAGEGGQGGDRKGVLEDLEGTARRMGWKPEGEFKGPKDKWRPADEYVETAMQNYPVLIDRYRTLDTRAAKSERQLAEATAKLDEIGSAVIEMRDFHAASLAGAEKRAYAQAVQDLKAEIEQATKDADPVAATAALKKLDKLIEDKPKETPEPKKKAEADGGEGLDGGKPAPKKTEPQIAPEVISWVAKNEWYNDVDRPELNMLAVGLHNKFKKTMPHLSLAENLERVAKEVKKAFPHEFPDENHAGGGADDDDDDAGRRENPRRRGAALVNEPGDLKNAPPRSQRGRTYADLPPEAKRACDKYVSTMVKGKDGKLVPMMTREDYLKNYQWEA